MSEKFGPHSSRPRPRRRLGGPPPRIGFIVDWLQDSYQGSVLTGAAEAARERGASLVVLPGGILGGTHRNGAQRNQLYELLHPKRYDALVVMTGTLGNQLGEDVVSTLCSGFPKARVCSVAIALEDSPSVLIDNRRGMQAAVEHLVTAHKLKRIAFIRGPVANMEAEERFWSYKDVLEAHGLPFDPRLVLQGDFQQDSGVDAVKTLLDERKIDPQDVDAIVAADDLMLLGVLDELKRRKIRVPEDIALMGFDDIEDARYASPPLSSVRQPFVEQGREAMRIALASIEGKTPDKPVMLSTKDHFRRSCGCIPDEDAFYTERPIAGAKLDLEASLIRQRDRVLAQMTRSARGEFFGAGRGWEVKVYNALQDELRGTAGAFRSTWSDLLQRVLDGNGDLTLGHAIISGLRRELNLAAGENIRNLRQVESILHDARVLTSDVIERSQAARRLRVEHWAKVLSEVSARLITTFDLARLGESISEQLPRLGIHSCYVSRYHSSDPERAELLLAYGPWGTLSPEDEPLEFPARDLIPARYLSIEDRTTLIVEPLSTEKEQLGFAVFEHGDVEAYVYEVLRELLTAALRGAFLVAPSA